MGLIDRFKAGVTAFKEAFSDGHDGPMGQVDALPELEDLIVSKGGELCISIPVQHEEHKDGDRGSDGVEIIDVIDGVKIIRE